MSPSQVCGAEEINQIGQHSHISYNVKSSLHMNTAINLELSQPEQQNNEASARNMKLWLFNNSNFKKSILQQK